MTNLVMEVLGRKLLWTFREDPSISGGTEDIVGWANSIDNPVFRPVVVDPTSNISGLRFVVADDDYSWEIVYHEKCD